MIPFLSFELTVLKDKKIVSGGSTLQWVAAKNSLFRSFLVFAGIGWVSVKNYFSFFLRYFDVMNMFYSCYFCKLKK